MAKMKSGDIGSDRAADKLREIEVTLDFTPNADASVLYRQGAVSYTHLTLPTIYSV